MKLTDEEIREIFAQLVKRREKQLDPGGVDALYYYARSIELCTLRDFMILRPTSLILIAKYGLGTLLAEGRDIAVHNFPGRTA